MVSISSKKMRNLLLIGSLVVILSLVLAACGDDEEDSTATSPAGSGGEVTATAGSESSGEGTAATGSEDSEASGEASSGETNVEFDRPIIFGDYGWDSAIVHDRIAQYVLENGYGLETDSISGETITLFQGLVDGDIDISMEIWADQQSGWEPNLEKGTIVDHGLNYPESVQGWWVPTYVIEGDAERGIEPMAPDLKSVDDLPKYKDLFKDAEDPSKGRFYDCIAGWECQIVNESKFEYYGLSETYNRFQPGSGAALATSLVSAYETGEPWVGYYWAPTWIFGKLDLTKLEEPEYTDECWDKMVDENDEATGEAGCAYPSVSVHISSNAEFIDQVPEVAKFLDNYETTLDQTSKILLYMQDNDINDHEVAAIWFLKNNEDLWTEWVPDDVAEKVLNALDKEDVPGGQSG